MQYAATQMFKQPEIRWVVCYFKPLAELPQYNNWQFFGIEYYLNSKSLHQHFQIFF